MFWIILNFKTSHLFYVTKIEMRKLDFKVASIATIFKASLVSVTLRKGF